MQPDTVVSHSRPRKQFKEWRAGKVQAASVELDNNQPERMTTAVQDDLRAWCKNHAVKACQRVNYAEKEVMNMRWTLRFKDTGQDKARQAIIRLP